MRLLAQATPSARPVAEILRDLAIALARQQAGEDNEAALPLPASAREGTERACESPSTADSRQTCRTPGR